MDACFHSHSSIHGFHRRIPLGVELVVLRPLEEEDLIIDLIILSSYLEKVDLVVASPDKCCVHTARDALEPVRDLLRKALKPSYKPLCVEFTNFKDS